MHCLALDKVPSFCLGHSLQRLGIPTHPSPISGEASFRVTWGGPLGSRALAWNTGALAKPTCVYKGRCAGFIVDSTGKLLGRKSSMKTGMGEGYLPEISLSWSLAGASQPLL